MEELEISPTQVAQVILMGRDIDREEAELRAFVDALGRDEQAELVALLWIGRGSFEADELSEAVTTATQEATTPCADYILGSPHMTDHLEAALEAFGHNVAELEDDLLSRGR